MVKICLAMILGIGLTYHSQTWAADFEKQRKTELCMMQTILHIDGNYSKKEQTFIQNMMPPSMHEKFKMECMISYPKLLQMHSEVHQGLPKADKSDYVVLQLLMATVFTEIDAKVHPKEINILEDILELHGRKRISKPLLDSVPNPIPLEIVKDADLMRPFAQKIADAYGFPKLGR